MEVPAGAKVRIIERIDEIQMYRIKYEHRVGLFLMRDFKPLPDPVPTMIPVAVPKTHATQQLNKTRDQTLIHSSQIMQKEQSSHGQQNSLTMRSDGRD